MISYRFFESFRQKLHRNELWEVYKSALKEGDYKKKGEDLPKAVAAGSSLHRANSLPRAPTLRSFGG